MRSVRRGTSYLVGMAAVLVMALVSAVPAGATTSTWTLEDIGQKICLGPTGWPNTYVFAPVTGTWDTPIRTGIRNLPAGSIDHGGDVLPPGSNHGNHINGWIFVSFAPAPAGDHVAEVWASDGEVTQTAPVLLRYGQKSYGCW